MENGDQFLLICIGFLTGEINFSRSSIRAPTFEGIYERIRFLRRGSFEKIRFDTTHYIQYQAYHSLQTLQTIFEWKIPRKKTVSL